MARLAAIALGIAIALAVPAVLAINGIRFVTNDRYVRAVYDHGGVPDDPYGFSTQERTRLALVGLHSIVPSSDGGIGLLRSARLGSGGPAFNARELAHMEDVRALLGNAYRVQLIAVVAIAGLAVLLGVRRSTRALVPVALVRGSLLTLVVAAVVAVLSITSYGWVSTPFHTIFFDGASWRFAETDTLRRLYPDRFWLDTAVVIGVLAVVQAVVLFPVARAWARRAGATQASRLSARTQGT
jgi:integral membrane protein (TIGR01906 family)